MRGIRKKQKLGPLVPTMVGVALLTLGLVVGCAATNSPQHPRDQSTRPSPMVEVPEATRSAKPETGEYVEQSNAPFVADVAVPESRWVRATAAMVTEGDISDDALLSAVNERLGALDPCVPLIRETDNGVGSLNLEVEVRKGGDVVVDLRSPVNEKALQCMQKSMSSWRFPKVVQGKAMVLLSLADHEPVE